MGGGFCAILGDLDFIQSTGNNMVVKEKLKRQKTLKEASQKVPAKVQGVRRA